MSGRPETASLKGRCLKGKERDEVEQSMKPRQVEVGATGVERGLPSGRSLPLGTGEPGAGRERLERHSKN